LIGVLAADGRDANEVFAAVRPNGWVDNKIDRAGLGEIDAGVEDLKLSLLQLVSDVDTD